MIALKSFAYRDMATGRRVNVRPGQELDTATLRQNRVDVDKLVRVRFAGQDEAGVVTTPRRSRKKKG